MSKISVTDLSEGTRYDHLPPVIICNVRHKVQPAEIPIEAIKLKQTSKPKPESPLIYYHADPPREPMSKHPLILSWEPEELYFDLFEEPVEAKLDIRNRSARPIQIQCCGLWDDTSRLGASWCCYPRTRFWLPPGLMINMFVRANPRPTSPISSATSSLQIAATHPRDTVTGYFAVPTHARFLKYIEPLPDNE